MTPDIKKIRDQEIASLMFERSLLSDAYFQLRKTSQKLSESETRYRLIVETTNEGILVIDEKQIITFVNPRMVTILGFDKTELIGKKIEDFIYPEDYKDHQKEMDYRKNGNPGFYERRFVQKNGSTIWCHVSATPVFDENNQFKGSFAMITDISDQKKKDEELHDSNEKFSAAFRAGPGLAAITRIKDGMILEINQNFADHFGYKTEDIVGKTTTEAGIWGNPKDRARFIGLLNKQGFVVNMNADFRRSNGEIFPGLISSQMVKIANEPCILSVAIDITELKQAEMALSQSENKYRSIFENTPDGVYLLEVTPEKHFRTIAVNPALERLTGIPASFSEGKTQEEIVAPEVAEVVNKKYRHCIESGKLIEEEVALDLPVGHRIFHSYLIPIKLSGKSISHILGISSDVTDIRKMEVHDREVDELKTKFIQIVSHQLRTPLSAIRWNLDMVMEEGNKKLTSKYLGLLRDSYQASIKIINRVGDLLEVVNVEENKVKLKKESVSIVDFLNVTCAQKNQEFNEKQVALRIFSGEDRSTKASIDMQKISAVVGRLIDNALDYTPSGGSVDIRIIIHSNTVRFEISDTGIGIPEAEQKHIFEKFFRGSEAPRYAPDAFGVSLYVSKKYIELHGGQIGFLSRHKNGSVFWFEIPIEAGVSE